ncbi:NAD-dependent epimerase/dehydratase family protein [bacterium]|nr:MAG: NAD-dependent epimerase/dehydratase family protein [bacterium]
MHIVLGVTGHVGSVVAAQLLEKGEEVAVVVRDEKKGDDWAQRGAKVVVADVEDEESLRRAFSSGDRLFMMLPPGDVGKDALREEYKILDNYHAALPDSGVKKIVGLSSYGAQISSGTGNLLASHRMEHLFADLPLKKSFVRPAYYFSNWDASLETAQKEGVVHTFFPPDLAIPMVAPQDIGELIARVMVEPLDTEAIYQVEGPEHYSSLDVAEAFSAALGKKVEAVETKPSGWRQAMLGIGFSQATADAFIAMTMSVVESGAGADQSFPVEKGDISLQQYVEELARQK